MKIDQKKIKSALKKTADEIRKHKAVRRRPPGGWPGYEEKELRAEATLLCSIQAHRRGKLHLSKWKSLEEQAAFIGDRWFPYEIGELIDPDTSTGAKSALLTQAQGLVPQPLE